MSKFNLVYIFISVVTLGACLFIVKDECPPNEEYLLCGFNTTCSNPDGPENITEDCIEGCFCKDKFFRNETGSCISMDLCPINPCLNENEVFDQCNADCEPTCDDPEPLCEKVCRGGCICSTGLLRDNTGACVAVDKCPPSNSTDPGILGRYIDAINKILEISEI